MELEKNSRPFQLRNFSGPQNYMIPYFPKYFQHLSLYDCLPPILIRVKSHFFL